MAGCLFGNVIGIKLYESLEMYKKEVLRQNYKAERGYLDQIIYLMLKQKFFDRKGGASDVKKS
ncbi:MAG: hypothetical protein KHY62_05310 [Firmicutes bacterium]|nr:hypothetical protein [Bacillota bacterium]